MPSVDPYLGNVYPVTFGQAGMVAHENRWLAQPTQLLIAENVTFENDVLQKDAAFAPYDAIGVDAPAYELDATSNHAGNWDGGMALIGGAVGTPTLVIGISATPHTSPWTFTVTNTALVGQVIVVSLWALITPPTITDSAGNVYTEAVGGNLVGGGTRNQGAPGDPSTGSYYQYHAPVTTQLTGGVGTITVTFTGGSTNLLAIVGAYFGTTTIFDWATAMPTAATFFKAPDPTRALVARHDYVYPMLGVGGAFFNGDTSAATITAGGSYTKLSTLNWPANGQLGQFYASTILQGPAIVAQIDWNSQATNTVVGTVTVTQNSTTVIGSGTNFVTDVRVNDEIIVNSEARSVVSVNSTTSLTTYTPYIQQTAAGQTATRRAGPIIVTAATQNFAGPLQLVIYKERIPGTLYASATVLPGEAILNVAHQPRLGRFVVAGKETAGQSRKLFFFNGCNPVNYLPDDASSMSAIGTPPTDWGAAVNLNKQPTNGILHQGALFGWGNLSDPHRIYRSQTGDHTVFINSGGGTNDAGQYPIASSIGERLWCGAEFQGVLFLWKYPRGIFYFDDTDPNFLNWTYHIRSEAIGCAPSPHAVLPIDDDVLFCAPDGHFHLLSAMSDLGGTRTSDVTRMLGLHRWTREHLDIPSLNQVCAVWNSYTKTAYIGVRSRTAPTQDNDLLLKFDFSRLSVGGRIMATYDPNTLAQSVRFSYSTSFRPNALCIRRSASSGTPKDGTPLVMIGEQSTSYLQLLDDGSVGTKLTHGFRNDPIRQQRLISTSYAITATTPRLDLADVDPMNRQRRKNFDFLEFIFGEADISDLSTQTITAQVYVDNKLKQTMTLTNITSPRVLRTMKVGDGYDWQVKITTQSTSSVAAVTPTVVPDMVGLGLQVYWRPGSQDHPANG